ncbi:MFS transporter [Sanguibacter keddieii]|nr:MFS transporter [Sanguibacter keddieii]
MSPAAGTHPRAWLAVCGVLFSVAWGGNEFTPLLVLYRLEGLSAQSVNVLLAAYVVGIVPALLVGGPLSDRLGRRPLMLPAPLLGVVGSGLIAWGAHLHALLFAGRVFSGLALGLVMAVGTSWVKELSQPPVASAADAGSGARRAALSLTAGFGLGAVVAAALAQYGPLPTLLPYLVNIAVTVVLAVPALSAPETVARQADPGRLRDDLRIPAARHRRFLLVVLPMAPWVFAVAACAYAILPALVAHRVPGDEIGFSGLLCLVALSCGFVTQQLARSLDTPRSARAVVVALAVTVVGMSVAAWAAATLDLRVTVLAAAVLGCAYGLLMLSGLQEAQRIAGPDDLAGIIAVFYSISYLGFFVPTVFGALSGSVSYPVMLAGGAVLAALCLLVVVLGWSRHLPQGAGSPGGSHRGPDRVKISARP